MINTLAESLKRSSPEVKFSTFKNSKYVKVITKDINLRVKCDDVGLKAEDYFKED